MGAEVGLYLAATGCTVTVIEMQDIMAYEPLAINRIALLAEMDKRGYYSDVESIKR